MRIGYAYNSCVSGNVPKTLIINHYTLFTGILFKFFIKTAIFLSEVCKKSKLYAPCGVQILVHGGILNPQDRLYTGNIRAAAEQ